MGGGVREADCDKGLLQMLGTGEVVQFNNNLLWRQRSLNTCNLSENPRPSYSHNLSTLFEQSEQSCSSICFLVVAPSGQLRRLGDNPKHVLSPCTSIAYRLMMPSLTALNYWTTLAQ